MPIPKPPSPGEEQFALHCRVEKLAPDREVCLIPGRKWRWDFYFPEAKLAVEIQGGTWSNGAHSRGAGYAKDCAKNNAAVLAGYRPLTYTTQQVASGQAIAEVLQALGRN